MSFRLITTPLSKRNSHDEKDIDDYELIVDTVHGNIGVMNNNLNHKEYNSAIEESKSDLQTLKILTQLMNEKIKKISYGSVNNVQKSDFDINKALEDKDILGSLQYLYDEYVNNYVNVDENDNVTLKYEKFNFADLRKDINDLYYSKSGSESLEYRLKNLLINTFTNSNISTAFNDIDELKLKENLNNSIKMLLNVESVIAKYEKFFDIYNNLSKNGIFEEKISSLEEKFRNLHEKTKSKKFREIKEINTNTSNHFYYDYYIPSKTNTALTAYPLTHKEESKESDVYNYFDYNFITSILDDNFDGDLNLYQIDGIYNAADPSTEYVKSKNTKSLISGRQQFFDCTVPSSLDLDPILVWDPVIQKPLYKYSTIKQNYSLSDQITTPIWSKYQTMFQFYNNFNHMILQQMYISSIGNIEPIFIEKNSSLFKDNKIYQTVGEKEGDYAFYSLLNPLFYFQIENLQNTNNIIGGFFNEKICFPSLYNFTNQVRFVDFSKKDDTNKKDNLVSTSYTIDSLYGNFNYFLNYDNINYVFPFNDDTTKANDYLNLNLLGSCYCVVRNNLKVHSTMNTTTFKYNNTTYQRFYADSKKFNTSIYYGKGLNNFKYSDKNEFNKIQFGESSLVNYYYYGWSTTDSISSSLDRDLVVSKQTNLNTFRAKILFKISDRFVSSNNTKLKNLCYPIVSDTDIPISNYKVGFTNNINASEYFLFTINKTDWSINNHLNSWAYRKIKNTSSFDTTYIQYEKVNNTTATQEIFSNFNIEEWSIWDACYDLSGNDEENRASDKQNNSYLVDTFIDMPEINTFNY